MTEVLEIRLESISEKDQFIFDVRFEGGEVEGVGEGEESEKEKVIIKHKIIKIDR